MSDRNISGSEVFPEFDDLFELIRSEISGLSNQQLDYTSDNWDWSGWSIRNQLSHMASLIPRWLIIRWGSTIFPDGDHGFSDIEAITNSTSDRRLDDDTYWEISKIMATLEASIDLTKDALRNLTLNFMSSRNIDREATPQWLSMSRAHPHGITATGNPASGTMTLEATFRHIYFEQITHLFNIQRLKRAQGLKSVSLLPDVGYWTLNDWDRSEP